MLIFRTIAHFWRWAKFCAKAIGTWGIEPGSNIEEMRANLENSVLRYEARAFHRESEELKAQWARLLKRN